MAAGASVSDGGVDVVVEEEYHDLAVDEKKTGRRGNGDAEAEATVGFLRRRRACEDSLGASCWSIRLIRGSV